MDNKDFAKKAFIGAFIWHLVKYFFRYPLKMTIIVVSLYLVGRYMIFNHPDTVRDGIIAVKDETVAVATQMGNIMNQTVNKNGNGSNGQ
jgi:hypothetical protein